MKPAWDELMDAYADSKDYLIADVDCTADGKGLCREHAIKAFPTIFYGNPADLKEYRGKQRDFDFLKKFAEDNLKPLCGPRNLDRCSANVKASIKKLQEMDTAALDALLAAEQEEMEEKEEQHKDEMKKLEDEFIAFKKKTSSGISLMKTVKLDAKKDTKEEL